MEEAEEVEDEDEERVGVEVIDDEVVLVELLLLRVVELVVGDWYWLGTELLVVVVVRMELLLLLLVVELVVGDWYWLGT